MGVLLVSFMVSIDFKRKKGFLFLFRWWRGHTVPNLYVTPFP